MTLNDVRLPPDTPASACRRAELAQSWLAEADVLARLGIGQETFAVWRKDRKLLAVWHAPENRYRYPPCQFNDIGLLPEMEPLLGYLGRGVSRSGWEEVEWLYANNPFLDGQRPADVLPNQPALVLDVAREQLTEDPDARW